MFQHTKNLPKKILEWYDNNKRNLPWRIKLNSKKKHYYVLISEFMLQQTQVKTVLPFFKKFLEKFPNLQTLSAAREQNVLKTWEGLGYYSRARNLLKTSKILFKKYDSQVPCDKKILKSLPGIGEYTSHALLSIIHNKNFIPIDGNIDRIFSRVFKCDSKSIKLKEKILKYQNLLKHMSRHGDFAEGLMELGAIVCRPKNPQCIKCPIKSNCLFFKRKTKFKKNTFPKSQKVFYLASCRIRKNKILATTKHSLSFLKGMVTVPMKKINQSYLLKKKLSNLQFFNYNISNKKMFIFIKLDQSLFKRKNYFWFNFYKYDKYPVPVLTKKIFENLKNKL